ncbi:MAG: phosphoribosyl-ATP diphosphatase [Candidatus Niameybacter stercoravium]|nr:phosphoribosyl-ATP diphosphatase [Candidatus Niameybacter stercoravium]
MPIQGGSEKEENSALTKLYRTIMERKQNPKEGSYTNYLFEQDINKILKKVGAEAAEVLIAAKDQKKEETVFEIADLLYHLSVLMAA